MKYALALNFIACSNFMYYVYILESIKDNKHYIGSTADLKKRFDAHAKGKVFATKGRLPIKLIFYESFIDQKDAIRREKYFKTNPGKRTLKLMLRSYLRSSPKVQQS